MASKASEVELEDPLYNLRLSIATSHPPILATSPDPTSAAETCTDLSVATHISFNIDSHHKTFDLTTPTRFAPNDEPISLRSIYFAWQHKESSLPEYIAAVQALNEELPSGAGGSVQNLSFALRIELAAYLKGETETSDNIKILEGAAASTAAENSAKIARGQGGVPVHKDGGKGMDVTLALIYDGERKMGDHNTVLRGTKQTDFSQYRKVAATFLRSRPSAVPAPHPPLISSLQKKPNARLQPIILLSPSASSLLRMSNIKSFLSDGVFHPPSPGDTSSNLLHLSRKLESISSQDLRFILVDSTVNFKPPYWSRVVAIFTTGQTWQFKSYKYPNPAELFAHYPGVYVGWQGEEPPESVQALGRGVLSVKVDKWTGNEKGRWRDREVVESIWMRIEENMRRGGWTRDGPGMAQPGR